ncbi:MAG TPA: class I SAM-dependent rRNA methyltransferase [Solibacterales bacterium]|nr:class I SAM-dependent rRNA methyltransferase [Bryobacterales bacterium]
MSHTDFRTVRVSRKGADRFASGHPWIYSSDVADRGGAAPGDVVRVTGPGGRDLGVAHFSSTSQITLRMLSSRVEPVDRAFYERRLRAALDHRRRVAADTDACRLVHGEGDLLPALVVDRYANCLVVQTLDQGMDRVKDLLFDLLLEITGAGGIVARNDVPVRGHESLPIEAGVVRGEVPDRVAIRMNGLALEADLISGPKTGVFLDQRENYLAAARHARGRALDCFTSTGGFALHMASACESVEGIDSSAPALAAAKANAARNGRENLTWREANVFDVLAAYDSAQRRYSTVVLDPPAFAKSKANLDAAQRGYKEINLRALRLLEPGGVLVTCSCSHAFHEALLMETVASAALDAGRTVRVLERRMQAMDHPVLLTVPETLYLKCLILEVL